MRIWLVPFRELDDKRVLGQHREAHMLWSYIVDHGHQWSPFWSDPRNRWALWDVHERSVAEMVRRGFVNHATPIPEPRSEPVRFRANRAELERDRWHLLARWGGMYRGRGNEPFAYLALRTRFKRNGCAHAEAVERLEDGTELCLVCKAFVRERGKGWRRKS